MNSRPNAAVEGLLSSAERWTPADAELWGRWRASLSEVQRSDALLPLQAVLSGLAAFRHLENQAQSAPATDFHPHLYAARVGYDWALLLVSRLQRDDAPQLQHTGHAPSEPEDSLRALKRSLSDALHVNEQLLGLPFVDANAFEVSCDLFLRELHLNTFFQPAEPLEFLNAAELMRSENPTAQLESWESDAGTRATMISFLALLRDHRFLGIADRQLEENEGVYRAHIVAAAVRKELRTLSRFLLLRGAESFSGKLETRLLSVEALAMGIHAKSRSALDYPLPELDARGSHPLAAERIHNGIQELRATVKDAAKQIYEIGRPARAERPERKSERLQRNLHQDIWAFRIILQAFIAKASVASVNGEASGKGGSLDFASEFLRHFRMFGLRLSRGTQYSRSASLTRAISALKDLDSIDESKLDLAMDESMLFLEHLDIVLTNVTEAEAAPFDKTHAADELRGYLTAVKQRSY